MKHLAIIAGRGVLPLQVAKAASGLGYEVFIFAIEGQADAVFDGFTFSQSGLVRLAISSAS
jgi:DUF1009 family protein